MNRGILCYINPDRGCPAGLEYKRKRGGRNGILCVHITVGYDRTRKKIKFQIDSFRIPEMGNPPCENQKKVFFKKTFNVWVGSNPGHPEWMEIIVPISAKQYHPNWQF